MKTYSYYVLFLLVVFCGCSRPTELTSPDGNIKLVFNLNEAGAMTYGVSVGGKPFILLLLWALKAVTGSISPKIFR